MTDRPPLPQPPPARYVALSSLALFGVIALLLAVRLLAGHDPAAGGATGDRSPAALVAPPEPGAAESGGGGSASAAPPLVTHAS